MGYKERMREATAEMRELAEQLSNQFSERPTEEEWEEIKQEVHEWASMLKHEVYGESNENRDRKNDWGDFGHEERMLIYHELKNAFHSHWKKLRKEIEKN